MALFGAHLTISLLCWLVFSKLQQYFSVAQWLITKGLKCYVPPSEEEMAEENGLRLPKQRKHKKNGASNDSVYNNMSVKCSDVNLTLTRMPVALAMFMKMEYFENFVYMVDFAMISLVNFASTELYYFVKQVRGVKEPDGEVEMNLSIVWCLLTAMFAAFQLIKLLKFYFTLESGDYRSASLMISSISFLLCMGLMLFGKDSFFDLDINESEAHVRRKLTPILQKLNWSPEIDLTILLIKLVIALICGLTTASLFFPAYRTAKMYFDSLFKSSYKIYHEDADGKVVQGPKEDISLVIRLCVYISFFLVMLQWVLWIKPLARNQWERRASMFSFTTVRFLILCFSFFLNFVIYRTLVQSHLNTGQQKVFEVKQEAGRTKMHEIRRKIAYPLRSLAMVSVQYFAPIVAVTFLLLADKALVHNKDMLSSGALNIGNLAIPQAAKEQAILLHEAWTVCSSAYVISPLLNMLAWWISLSSGVLIMGSLVQLRRMSAK